MKNYTGKRFEKLTVLKFDRRKNGRRYWLCKCDCGNETIVSVSNLKKTKSCGCEQFIGNHKTHGRSKTTEYKSWSGMIERCTNQSSKHYKRYGGRGISVCDEWRNSFETFFNDMGLKPSPKHSIDRINNDKGYSKENCRWATHVEQVNNSTTVRLDMINGIVMNRQDCAKFIGIHEEQVRLYYKKGLTGQEIYEQVKRKNTQKLMRLIFGRGYYEFRFFSKKHSNLFNSTPLAPHRLASKKSYEKKKIIKAA